MLNCRHIKSMIIKSACFSHLFVSLLYIHFSILPFEIDFLPDAHEVRQGTFLLPAFLLLPLHRSHQIPLNNDIFLET